MAVLLVSSSVAHAGVLACAQFIVGGGSASYQGRVEAAKACSTLEVDVNCAKAIIPNANTETQRMSAIAQCQNKINTSLGQTRVATQQDSSCVAAVLPNMAYENYDVREKAYAACESVTYSLGGVALVKSTVDANCVNWIAPSNSFTAIARIEAASFCRNLSLK